MFDWLSFIIFFPLISSVILLFIPKENHNVIKVSAYLISLLTFFFSLVLLYKFSINSSFQFEVNKNWITALGISYHIGVDGISIFLILLTTFLTPIIVLSSFKAVTEKVKEYMFFILLLETSIIGALVSLDLILFYLFWEMMLIPMYFLIGIFGGEDKVYATLKFFIYTMVGSVLMLIAILYLFANTGMKSFDLKFIIDNVNLTAKEEFWLFLAFFLAFAIKVPIFPFHTWLPDAHVQAPTGGSVILAGVLLKMGTYGFLRFSIPLFPDSTSKYAFWIALLGVIGIIYGALVSLVQKDVKKLIAYSSISHLGFVVLGIFAFTQMSVTGGVYQMLNHGISTGGLFLIVGILYERRHTKKIADFGGITKVMPLFAVFFMIIMLSSIALPLTNGFVGEFLILSGTYSSQILSNANLLAIISTSGVILGAGYMLWTYQRVMYGPLNKDENKVLKDLTIREFGYLLPIIVMIFVMGIFPNFFIKRIEPSVDNLLKNYTQKVYNIENPDTNEVVLNKEQND